MQNALASIVVTIVALGIVTPMILPGASAAEVTFNLFGTINGWGLSAGTITNPGPTLTVNASDSVTLILHSTDGVRHNWFLDVNNNRVRDANELVSPDFDEGTPIVTWTFTAPAAGTYTYRCQYHPTSMTGTLSVQGAPGTQPAGGLDWTLILVIVVAVAVIGAVAAVAAVAARRRKKT